MINEGKYSTRLRSLMALAYLLLFLQSTGIAQSIQFSMDIEPELGIEVLQNLDFGTVVSNSGVQQVSPGDYGMGIFELRAFSAQNAFLSIEPPDSLRREDTGSGTAIPLKIQAVFSQRPGNYTDLTPFEDQTAWVSLASASGSGATPSWETGYIYVFGEINVGDIGTGNYSGTLTLNVTYQ